MFFDLSFFYFFVVEDLATRDDSLGYFLDLCGCEDETNIVSWFFDGFEEGVECAFTEHVDLIDDIDFLFEVCWWVCGSIEDLFSDIIYSCM